MYKKVLNINKEMQSSWTGNLTLQFDHFASFVLYNKSRNATNNVKEQRNTIINMPSMGNLIDQFDCEPWQ